MIVRKIVVSKILCSMVLQDSCNILPMHQIFFYRIVRSYITVTSCKNLVYWFNVRFLTLRFFVWFSTDLARSRKIREGDLVRSYYLSFRPGVMSLEIQIGMLETSSNLNSTLKFEYLICCCLFSEHMNYRLYLISIRCTTKYWLLVFTFGISSWFPMILFQLIMFDRILNQYI